MTEINIETFFIKLDEIKSELYALKSEVLANKSHEAPCSFLCDHISSQSGKVRELHNQHKEHIDNHIRMEKLYSPENSAAVFKDVKSQILPEIFFEGLVSRRLHTNAEKLKYIRYYLDHGSDAGMKILLTQWPNGSIILTEKEKEIVFKMQEEALQYSFAAKNIPSYIQIYAN